MEGASCTGDRVLKTQAKTRKASTAVLAERDLAAALGGSGRLAIQDVVVPDRLGIAGSGTADFVVLR